MGGSIPKQRWQSQCDLGGHSGQVYLDLACIFWIGRDNNDINVLDRSPLVANMLKGEGHDMTFQVNGHMYPKFYLLTDGIYPPWSCFVRPIHQPQGEMKKHFTKMQEGVRKDVERAFGILQARWEIIKNPIRHWDLGTISDIMLACIIMHNMIIENKHGLEVENLYDRPLQDGHMQREFTYYELEARIREIEDSSSHLALQNDLTDHLWLRKGRNM